MDAYHKTETMLIQYKNGSLMDYMLANLAICIQSSNFVRSTT